MHENGRTKIAGRIRGADFLWTGVLTLPSVVRVCVRCHQATLATRMKRPNRLAHGSQSPYLPGLHAAEPDPSGAWRMCT